MEKIFVSLLNMSITAGWIVIALVLLRPLIKKLPKWVGCTLWALVGIRLLLPFSFESVLSLIPSAETIPSDIAMQRNPAVHTGIQVLNHAVNPVITHSFAPKDTLTSINPLQVVEFVMANVWVLGMIAMLLYALISFVSLKMKLRTATLLERRIYESEFVESPFILSNNIYLPYNMSQEEREYCLLHERAHLKRGDHLIKPIAYLFLTVYWFNPLMWVAFVLLCRDIELACDEKVIKELAETERREYSLALVKNSISRKRIAACPLAFGEVGVKERVKRVMNYKKPAFWVVVSAIALSIVLTVCFLTNPAGMKITGIEDHGKMLDDVYSVNIIVGDETDARFGSHAEEIVKALKSLRVEEYPISQNRSEDRDSTNRLVIRYGDSNPTMLCFNADCTEVYINNGVKPTLSYEVKNPEKIQKIFKFNYIDGILRVLSSGSDVEGVSISIKNYNFGDKPYLKVEWKNDTNKDFAMGEYFDLLYSNGMGNSFSCAKEGVAFKDIGYILHAHDSIVMTYDLSHFDVSKSGYYTFKANYGGNLWIDFILDYGSFYQDDIIELEDIENENLSKLFQAGNAISPISSIRFEPVFRLDTKKDFEDFAKKYDFITFKNGGDLLTLAQNLDENLFDDYSLLLAVVPHSSKVTVGEFFVGEEGMRLHLHAKNEYGGERLNWLVITPVQKRELNETELTATLWGELVGERTYYYYFSPDPFAPSLVLREDGTGSFSYSVLSSTANFGRYKNNGETIVLTTDDKRYYFTFIIDGDRLIFDAENSSEIPKYRYSENGVLTTPVPDGAVFE